MKFSLAAAAVSLASVIYAQPDCPEASRFGVINVNVTTAKVGEPIRVVNDLTCTTPKGIHPRFIDYYLEVPTDENNGHQFPLYLHRSTFNSDVKLDVVYTKIPLSSTITDFPNSTDYVIRTQVIHSIEGIDGKPVLIAGGTETGITIISSY